MNCVLHDISVPRIVRVNTLSDDVRKYTERDRYHVILTNPPFGGTENVDAIRDNFRYPSSATSILFLQHIMARLRRDGRAGMVIDEGVLFKAGERAYVDTKRELLEECNLYAAISLPAGVFTNVTASGEILPHCVPYGSRFAGSSVWRSGNWSPGKGERSVRQDACC